MKERKPLSDVGQIIQPPVKNIVQSDEKDNLKEKDESADSSCVYSPMLVDHDKSMPISCLSLTAHRLSSNIDIYTTELYAYLRNVEVMNNNSVFRNHLLEVL